LLRHLDRPGDSVHVSTLCDTLAVAALVLVFGAEQRLRVALLLVVERVPDV